MLEPLPSRAAARHLPQQPALLCIAHPGHELRVYGWLTLARPLVVVLTDGSGRSGRSRVAATRETLAEVGATASEIFGHFADAEAYERILASDAEAFIRIVDRLAAAILESGARYVAGDAAEGYNPMHDLCRVVINAATSIARRRGQPVGNFDFPLVGSPDACPDHLRSRAVALQLEPELLGRKLAAARRSADLAPDVEAALRASGAAAFGIEVLRPVEGDRRDDGLPDEPPYYEQHGEGRVAGGKYAMVLRRREHILPLAESLWRHVDGVSPQ